MFILCRMIILCEILVQCWRETGQRLHWPRMWSMLHNVGQKVLAPASQLIPSTMNMHRTRQSQDENTI